MFKPLYTVWSYIPSTPRLTPSRCQTKPTVVKEHSVDSTESYSQFAYHKDRARRLICVAADASAGTSSIDPCISNFPSTSTAGGRDALLAGLLFGSNSKFVQGFHAVRILGSSSWVVCEQAGKPSHHFPKESCSTKQKNASGLFNICGKKNRILWSESRPNFGGFVQTTPVVNNYPRRQHRHFKISSNVKCQQKIKLSSTDHAGKGVYIHLNKYAFSIPTFPRIVHILPGTIPSHLVPCFSFPFRPLPELFL